MDPRPSAQPPVLLVLELNAAIAKLLVELNRPPFKKLPGCRAEAFESIDRRAMKSLPATCYEYAEWVKAKVGIDYHVEAVWHYYSVPHSLVGGHVMVRVTDSTIECFFKGGRVAAAHDARRAHAERAQQVFN